MSRWSGVMNCSRQVLRYSWLSCVDERGRRGILEGRVGGGEGGRDGMKERGRGGGWKGGKEESY